MIYTAKKQDGKGVLELIVECEVRDKDGKITSFHRQKSKSFVANMLRILRRQFLAVGLTGGPNLGYACISGTEPVDTGNTARGVVTGNASAGSGQPINQYVMKADALAGDVTHGIRVGSGTTPVTPTDYNLATPIAQGTGAGQLDHGAVTVETISIVTNTTRFRVIRTFTNSSGSTITVYEIGLIVYCTYSLNLHASHMIGRDVLTTPQSVPNGQTLTVRYILQVTS